MFGSVTIAARDSVETQGWNKMMLPLYLPDFFRTLLLGHYCANCFKDLGGEV